MYHFLLVPLLSLNSTSEQSFPCFSMAMSQLCLPPPDHHHGPITVSFHNLNANWWWVIKTESAESVLGRLLDPKVESTPISYIGCSQSYFINKFFRFIVFSLDEGSDVFSCLEYLEMTFFILSVVERLWPIDIKINRPLDGAYRLPCCV